MNIERLKQLASGLRKLAPDQYKHRDISRCALGQCGRIFPEFNTNYKRFNEGRRFFGITYQEVAWLF